MSYAGIFTDKNNVDHPVTSTLYGTCATAAATAEKAVVCSNVDVLSAGMTLRVVFTYANEAETPTINVNSLGAKSVYRFGTTKPLGGNSWEAGAVVDLFYDGTSFYMLNSDNLGTAAAKDVPASGNASSTQVVMGDDTRLTDARTPVSHTHTKSEITDFPTLGTAAAKDATNAITENSTDLVESGAVYTGLAAKQDASGNSSLTTTDKTIVGAINEVNSNFTSLEDWTDADAKTLTGNPITITDAANLNAKALSMTVEPIQDLHGYDKPWVGGAGKNKAVMVLETIKDSNTGGTWDGNTYTFRGISFEVKMDSDGNITSIVANGTSSDDWATLYLGGTTLPAGSYILSGSNGGSSSTWRISYGSGNIVSYDGDTRFTLSDSTTYNVMVIIRTSGTTVNNVVFYPMLRLSTEQDATFAPYTNICPISGLTEASVQRDGANIFLGNSTSNPQYVGNYYVNSSNYNYVKTENAEHNCFQVEVFPSDTYIFVRETALSNVGHIRFLDKNKEFISGTSLNASADYATFNTPSSCKYIEFAIPKSTQYSISVNYPSTDTTFYNEGHRNTYTITFGEEVYGGTVDFKTGMVTVTHGIKVYSSADVTLYSDNYSNLRYAKVNKPNNGKDYNQYGTHGISSKFYMRDIASGDFNNIRNIGVMCGNIDGYYYWIGLVKGVTLEEAQSLIDGTQIVYELATPTELTLTPAQLELLKGNNTITANGAIISLTYQPDNLVGEVMEQVDDIVDPIEARLETVESGLDAVKNRLIASSQSTGTTRSKLNDLYTAWQNLTDDEKRRAYIFAGENTKYNLTNKYYRIFNNTAYSASDSALFSRTIELKSSASTSIAVEIKDTGTTITDKSLDENSTIWHLYV